MVYTLICACLLFMQHSSVPYCLFALFFKMHEKVNEAACKHGIFLKRQLVPS